MFIQIEKKDFYIELNNFYSIYIINYNKLKENDYFARVGYITVDEFMFLKHNKKVKRLGLDHSNDYEFKKDRNGHTWKTSPACYICNSQGEEVHAYVKTVLKEFSGKRKWSN